MSFKVVKYYASLEDFEPWGGAIQVYERIMNDQEARYHIEGFLSDLCLCNWDFWDDTTVNDFLWFDAEQVLIDSGIWDEE